VPHFSARRGRKAAGIRRLADRAPHFRDNVLFYEFFHGDNGRGLGASHQTGWTALIACLLRSYASTAAVRTAAMAPATEVEAGGQ